jgi:hypothetical protein
MQIKFLFSKGPLDLSPRKKIAKEMYVVIRVKVENEELVPIALNGFFSSSNPSIWGVYAHENIPTFEKLRDDFIWKETRPETILIGVEESQNLAFIEKMRKGGKKGGPRRGHKEDLVFLEQWNKTLESRKVIQVSQTRPLCFSMS